MGVLAAIAQIYTCAVIGNRESAIVSRESQGINLPTADCRLPVYAPCYLLAQIPVFYSGTNFFTLKFLSNFYTKSN